MTQMGLQQTASAMIARESKGLADVRCCRHLGFFSSPVAVRPLRPDESGRNGHHEDGLQPHLKVLVGRHRRGRQSLAVDRQLSDSGRTGSIPLASRVKMEFVQGGALWYCGFFFSNRLLSVLHNEVERTNNAHRFFSCLQSTYTNPRSQT